MFVRESETNTARIGMKTTISAPIQKANITVDNLFYAPFGFGILRFCEEYYLNEELNNNYQSYWP